MRIGTCIYTRIATTTTMLMTIMIVKPVGESTHADPDAFEHAVASELVHDERGLHPAGLLVRVGHDAPDVDVDVDVDARDEVR